MTTTTLNSQSDFEREAIFSHPYVTPNLGHIRLSWGFETTGHFKKRPNRKLYETHKITNQIDVKRQVFTRDTIIVT